MTTGDAENDGQVSLPSVVHCMLEPAVYMMALLVISLLQPPSSVQDFDTAKSTN